MKNLLYSLFILTILVSCNTSAMNNDSESNSVAAEGSKDYPKENLTKAYFASGCFWCVEAIFESVEGVQEAISGYAGGHTPKPTYKSIGTGTTGHTESIEVIYDSTIVSFETLLKVYYGSQDPTTEGQSPDFGSQYRSVIFYSNEMEKKLAESAKKTVMDSGEYDKPIVTEILPLEKFHKAEEYHQDFEKLNPEHTYIRRVSIPRLKRFQAKFPDLIKKDH